MGQKLEIIPAFTAGPLLMPPIQLKDISGQADAASVGGTFPQPAALISNGRVQLSSWPCLRQFGLYGAHVVPLTLSSIIKEAHSGSPAMPCDEQSRWIPGARKPPVRAQSEAPAAAPMSTRVTA